MYNLLTVPGRFIIPQIPSAFTSLPELSTHCVDNCPVRKLPRHGPGNRQEHFGKTPLVRHYLTNLYERVIPDVNDNDGIIKVLKVGSRKNVYDRYPALV